MRETFDNWREKARLIATTVAITSVAWVIAGALWLRPQVPAVPRPAVATMQPASPNSTPQTMLIPVQGVAASALTDTFTQSRANGARQHDAIDILAPVGTPVLAAMPGRVEKLFLSKDGGNTIYVRSADGMTMTYYAHLSAYAPDLAEGQQVRAGQVIGAVGSTGNADPAAPHLHFAVFRTTPQTPWHQGEAINPYPLLHRVS